MTFKEFIATVSKELYQRAELAQELERQETHEPASVVFRASAGVIEAMARRYEGKITLDHDTTKKASVMPLVIVEGSMIQGTEATLVGDVTAAIIDWDLVGVDADQAAELKGKLQGYFASTGLPTDPRVNSILERLSKVVEDYSDDEDFDDDDDDEDFDDDDEPEDRSGLGDYHGIPHTGKPDCPACQQFVEDAKRESGFDVRSDPIPNDFTRRLVEIVSLIPFNRMVAMNKFQDLKRDYGV